VPSLKQEKMQVLILIKKVIGRIESERNLWRELYVLSDRGLLIVKMKNHVENRPLSKKRGNFQMMIKYRVILRSYINEVYSMMIMMSIFGILKETNKNICEE